MEKLYTSKTFLRMAGGWMHTPDPTSLDPLLAISCRIHQKSMAYFSHLAPLVFFYQRAESLGGGWAWHNAPLSKLPPLGA